MLIPDSVMLLQAMCLVAEELFRDAFVSATAMRQDRSGHVRAQLVQCVFGAAASRAEVAPSDPSAQPGNAKLLAPLILHV